MSFKHHKTRSWPEDEWDWPEPDVLRTIRALLPLGITYSVIGRLIRFKKDAIKRIREREASDVDRGTIHPGWPGTGDYATCPACGKHARMPCTACVVRAMRKNPEEEKDE